MLGTVLSSSKYDVENKEIKICPALPSVEKGKKSEQGMLDSGCTLHMSNHIAYFSTFVP